MAEPEASNLQSTKEYKSSASQMREIYESLRKLKETLGAEKPQSESPKKQDKTKLSGPSETQKVNIFGPRGVGKTRMAKKVSERAIKTKVCDFTIWVFMCREYTKDSLCMSIARQLFLIPANEEWEVDDDNVKVQEQDHDEVPDIDSLAKKVIETLKRKTTLVVLDDVPNGKSENEIKFWSVWNDIMEPHDLTFITVLISIKKSEDDGFSPENTFEIMALRPEVCNNLLKENIDAQLPGKSETLEKEFFDKFKGDLPARMVILMAKVLNYFCADASGVVFLKKQLVEATETDMSLSNMLSKMLCNKHDVLPIGVLKDLRWHGHHFFRDSGSVHYSELIAYWILEGYLGGGRMTKLYQKGHGVLMELVDCGVVKLQEGGYVFMDQTIIDEHDLYQFVDQNPKLGLGTVISSEKEGFGRITHNNGMLKTTPMRRRKKLRSDEHVQDPATKLPSDERVQDPATKLPSDEHVQDSATKLRPDEHVEDLPTDTTLLLDGTRFSESKIESYVKKKTKLEAFGLFYPTIKSLPRELEEMEGLRVLVLRGCEFLEVAKVSLKALEVLEISSGRILKRLTSSFFKHMLNLKSLHLSGLQIQSLPQAIYNLEHIQWLIVKDCPRLKKVESISKLVKLIVVDLSGNTSLDTLDKNFLKFEKLQSLNLSETRVSTTPLLKNRKELTHLLCRDCKDMDRLRGLTSLTRLQTIDLKGSIKFEEFHDSSLESLTSLITLDLSETAIDRLPSNISRPRYLYLKNCLKLRRLECIISLEKLEILDVSGSSNLEKIDEKFFDRMNHLRVLNLTKTSISVLPSLSNLSNLRELYLSQCPSLINLPSLESSTKLGILDASNSNALQNVESKSFESMTRIEKINFSNTKIESFPLLPNPCTLLRQLLLKNCNALKNFNALQKQFPKLEELNLSCIKSLQPNGAEFVKDINTLKILDLSETSIKQLPSMSNLTNLTKLSLAGCILSSETELDYPHSKIEVLDISRSSFKRLPNLKNHTNLQKLMLKDCSMLEKPEDLINTSTCLEYIEFPNNNVASTPYEVNNDVTSKPKEVNQDHWSICKLPDIYKAPVFHNPSQFLTMNPSPNPPSHLCVVPNNVEGELWDTYLQRYQLVFRDVYLQTPRFALYKDKNVLQIRGFNQFPKAIESIIKDMDSIFLIDYNLSGFPSGLYASMLPKLKGCWIERCNEMVTIFDENKPNNNDAEFNIPLEDLAVCNNNKLQSIYRGKQPFGSFDSLKSLYIDNCRGLTTVFSSSWLPRKLEVLEIKYCDNIVEFGGKLPQSLQALKIWECPKLKQLEDEFEIPKSLKTLSISGATTLKKFVSKNDELIDLENLKVENCPMLKYVTSSSSLLACINIIDIRSCERMKSLFKDDINKTNLSNMKKLHLVDLPVLKQIIHVHLQSSDQKLINIVECPNLTVHNID